MAKATFLKDIWINNFDKTGSLAQQAQEIITKYFSKSNALKPKEILVDDTSFGFRLGLMLKKQGLPIKNETLVKVQSY